MAHGVGNHARRKSTGDVAGAGDGDDVHAGSRYGLAVEVDIDGGQPSCLRSGKIELLRSSDTEHEGEDTARVCLRPSCRPRWANLQANKLLVMDVAAVRAEAVGWEHTQQGEGSVRAMTPSECCEACHDHPECNVWVTCVDPEGCGSTCNSDFAKSMRDQGMAFQGCGPRGRWPHGLCTLKQSGNGEGNLVNEDDTDGHFWVSGVLHQSQGGALLPRAQQDVCPRSTPWCHSCLRHAEPWLCIDCFSTISNPAWANAAVVSGIEEGRKSSICWKCLDSPARPDCLRCVKRTAHGCKPNDEWCLQDLHFCKQLWRCMHSTDPWTCFACLKEGGVVGPDKEACALCAGLDSHRHKALCMQACVMTEVSVWTLSAPLPPPAAQPADAGAPVAPVDALAEERRQQCISCFSHHQDDAPLASCLLNSMYPSTLPLSG